MTRTAKLELILACFRVVINLFLLVFILTSTWLSVSILVAGVIFYLTISMLSLPCADKDAVDQIFGANGLPVVAHRACGLDAPENSVSALLKIIKEGYDAIEFDVQLTSDGVAVVFHDATLARMAQDPRQVKSLTLNELKNVSISAKQYFGDTYANERIPTMKDYVNLCVEKNIRMFIDIKGDDMKVVPAITSLFDENPKLLRLAIVSSFHPLIIYKIRAANPKIVGCLAWRSFFYTHGGIDENGPTDPRTTNLLVRCYLNLLNSIHSWLYNNVFYSVLGLSAILLHKDLITKEVRDCWKKKDVRVLAWTVNLPSEKEYFDRILKVPYLTDTVIRK